MTVITRMSIALLVFVSSQALALGIPAPFEVRRDPAPVSVSLGSTGTPSSALPTPSAASKNFKALWDGKNANSSQWTLDAQTAVADLGPSLLRGSSDIETFCPSYDRIGTQDRINFWVQLLAAMTKYESGFNPASRMTETTMGIDPLTGRQTASEGLLQLSYSDAKNYGTSVCDFDYSKDKSYAVSDLRRTILDPRRNIRCGVGILNKQIAREGKIAVASNAYWAVIKTDRSTNKISEIRAVTRALSFCNL